MILAMALIRLKNFQWMCMLSSNFEITYEDEELE